MATLNLLLFLNFVAQGNQVRPFITTKNTTIQKHYCMKCKFTLLPLAFVLLIIFFGNTALSQVKTNTQRQIQNLALEKKSRTAAERKISSQLLQAVRESTGKQMAEGVRLRPANVRADAAGNLQIDINANVNPALLARINALGGKIIYSSAKYHSVTARVNLSMVQAIAGYNEVRQIRPAAKAHTVGGTNPSLLPAKSGAPSGQPQPLGFKRPSLKERTALVKKQLEKYMMVLGTGSVNAEGDHTLGADSAKAKYGYFGQGIRIGVMSDSYNANGGEADDIANGELPGPGNPLGNTTAVTVLQDYSGGTDEGRAMMQIIHDIAPKAQLFFATAYNSDANFAANITALRGAPYNCDIIIDDVSYFNEPVFQDGIIAQAVNEVTANGALYFSSAGNAGSKLFDYSSVYEGDFNDKGSVAIAGGTIHNFGKIGAPEMGDSLITSTFTHVNPFYTLNWADPLGSSANDYDLFLVDSSGNVIASSTDIQDGHGDPYEYIDSALSPLPGDQLVVFKSTGAASVAFSLNANLNGQGKGFKYTTASQTHGHSSAADAFSVAAADASLAYPGLFTSATQVEYFSSDGPRRMFFNADSTPITPGNFLIGSNGGSIRKKPDITAADGVATSVAGFAPFYGTSAAAPHAGAVAALIKSAKPSLSAAQIRTILTGTALDIEAAGYDYNSGYGIVQPWAALSNVNPTALATVTYGNVTATEGAFSNSNGVLDPGENGHLVVKLLNLSLGNATAVTAILTTSTPGVTVTQGHASYGNIAAGGSAVNTGTPFDISINPSVPCGTEISFYLTASLGGGAASPQSISFTIGVGGLVNTTISSTLGVAASAGSGYTAVSGQQTGRLSRGADAYTCSNNWGADTLIAKTGQRQYDAYTFKNTSPHDQCVTVTLASSNGLNIYSAAYGNAGFVPANPAANFLANPGQSATTMQYSFTAVAGAKYTVVVHDVNVLPASNSKYTLTLSYIKCAAAPACTPVKITTASIATGATGTAYKQVFTATGGSGNYIFSVSGALPAGVAFNGDSLYGKPTQAGHFPLVVTAIDPIGCPSDSQKDTLAIAGIVPASVIAFAGTPQQAIRNHLFADTLKAKVFDASNVALPGVNVIFVAPSSGASGGFLGGSDTAIVVTDNNGVATAPAFTANGVAGSYTVNGGVTGVATPAAFLLTNVCGTNVVTNNNDGGAGSLRSVIADACPDSTITFAPGITNISLTSGQIPINQALTINGPGADILDISGSYIDRVFQIAAPDTAVVTLAGLTISEGVPGGNFGGGGVLILGGNVNVNNSVLTNNSAYYTKYGEGGAIESFGSSLTIDGSSLINNYAYYDGGALAVQYGTTAINNSTIAGNNATQTSSDPSNGGWGGGIFTVPSLTITNSTIYGNTAQDGSNIYSYYIDPASSITLNNTVVSGGIITAGYTGIGPDVYGANFVSAGYNLIGDTTSATIAGFSTSDITGVDAGLLPLNNYGGTTPTLLPAPNSPVVNKGDASLTPLQLDQRGYARVAAGLPDIGAVEANYTSFASAGATQSTAVGTTFAKALAGKVTENGKAIQGISVMFRAPASTTIASGTFANGTNTATATTNISGIATAPAFTANANTGSYLVFDSIGSAFGNTGFFLTNTKALAVTFGHVSASVSNCTVQIVWNTLTGQNRETFGVERSTDGTNYTALYTTQGTGNSNTVQTYKYTDEAPAVGTNYYRVKQTDAGGSIVYSPTITAVNTCSNAPIIAYPNPVRSTLTLIMPGTEKQEVSIYDGRGRLVVRYLAIAGRKDVDVSHWAGGTYTVTVAAKGKAAFNLKFVKN